MLAYLSTTRHAKRNKLIFLLSAKAMRFRISTSGGLAFSLSAIGPEPKHALANGMSAFEEESEEGLRHFDSRL